MKHTLVLLALACLLGTASAQHPIALADQTHGNPRILLMNPAEKDWSLSNPQALLWSWKPSDSGIGDSEGWTLPNDARLRRVQAWGNNLYMVTASGYGLIAVVSYPDKVRKWSIDIGKAFNIHGIELLPDGNVAAAASTGSWVRVYAASQGPKDSKYAEFKLHDAHNVLWDPTRDVLWAVGGDKLVQLRVGGTEAKPSLTLAHSVTLPEGSAHDLEADYGHPDLLWITTGRNTWSFNKDTGVATKLQGRGGVKSINNQPSGQLIETKPHASCTQNTWCTDVVDFFHPEDERVRPTAVIYRARLWDPDYQ